LETGANADRNPNLSCALKVEDLGFGGQVDQVRAAV
jgi:hypothetical protein